MKHYDPKAILALYPNVGKVEDEVVYDSDDNVIDVDWDAIQSWVDPSKYQEERLREYPSIGDQLDALFKAGAFPEDMQAKIQAVKDAFPKPEE